MPQSTPMTICVAGASGLVGSNVVKAALAKGHRVHGTLRNAEDTSKTQYLKALPGARDRLTLFSADTEDAASFDAPMEGATAVVIACFPPIYKAFDHTPAKELDRVRGFEEIVRPIREGALNVLISAHKAGVHTVVLGSSTSSTNPPFPVDIKTEATAISDAEHQMAQGKFTAAEKVVMETAALDFCVAHNMRLSIMLPTMMLGPVIIPQHLDSDSHALPAGLLAGKKIRHQTVPAGSMSVSHIEDVAGLFMAAVENPGARGRYFAVYDSWSWRDLYAEFAKHVPGEAIPAPLEGEPETPTRFDFTRRDSLGQPMRDIPTTIAETFDWLKTNPFQ